MKHGSQFAVKLVCRARVQSGEANEFDVQNEAKSAGVV